MGCLTSFNRRTKAGIFTVQEHLLQSKLFSISKVTSRAQLGLSGDCMPGHKTLSKCVTSTGVKTIRVSPFSTDAVLSVYIYDILEGSYD